MAIIYEDNQPHQAEAISSVVRLFEGQSCVTHSFALHSDDGIGIKANQLHITADQLWDNYRNVVQAYNNRHPLSRQLSDAGHDKGPVSSFEFSIEQETGTGKTYVYLRTILELYKNYGFSKFVLFVHSVAVKEGVIAAAKSLDAHFRALYGDAVVLTPVDGDSSSHVRGYAESTGLQVLLMTKQAIDKQSNIFNRETEQLGGLSPRQLVAATRPFIILDEPQKMEGAKFTSSLQQLEPLAVLRYSATHVSAPNMVYRLGPKEAFEANLVKQIAVWGVENQSASRAEVRFVRRKGARQAEFDVLVKGEWLRKAATPGLSCDLEDLTGDPAYFRWCLEDFALEGKGIRITTGQGNPVYELLPGQATRSAVSRTTLMKRMVQGAVAETLRKEERLRKKGIKPLAVFFIPSVSLYDQSAAVEQGVQPLVRQWIEEAYASELAKYGASIPDYLPQEPSTVHSGYFARLRGVATDSLGTAAADRTAEQEAIDLILKNKERLISLDEPTRFVVSHSALREGWDNPNVFVIALLNSAGSDIVVQPGTRRQELGRGLRLPLVPATGRRLSGEDEECELTAFVGETFQGFVRGLQEDFGVVAGESSPKVKNAGERKAIQLKPSWATDPAFIEMWDKVKQRTRYRVAFDNATLTAAASILLKNTEPMPAPHLVLAKGRLDSTLSVIGAPSTRHVESPVEVWRNPVAEVSARVGVTPGLVVDVIKRSGRQSDYLINPDVFIERTAFAIQEALDQLLVNGIEYIPDGTAYQQQLIEAVEGALVSPELVGVIPEDKGITQRGELSLDSQPEVQFATDYGNRDEVRFVIKLPRSFTIKTPIGMYSPDWALLVEEKNGQKLVMVKETKSSLSRRDLRGAEALKIEFGKKHFAALGISFAAEAVAPS